MQQYLRDREMDIRREPIVLDNSRLRYVNAAGIYLPFLRGVASDMTGANFRNGSFFSAYLKRARFASAVLAYTDLAETDFRCADLEGANCWKSEFAQTDLRNVRNLHKAKHLGDAHYHKTKINKTDKQVIESALLGRNLFDLANVA